MIRTAWQRMRGATAFGADTVLTLGANGLISVQGAISGVVIARLLGPQRRGEFAAIQTFSGFVATIAMLGMIEAVIYYCARCPQRAGRYIASAVTIALFASIPFLLGAYFVMPVALAAQSSAVIRSARWYLLMAPVYALVAIPAHAMRGRGDFVAWNGIRLLPNFIWIVVLIAIALTGSRSSSVFVAAYVAAQAAVFFPVAYIVRRRVAGPYLPSLADWRGMIQYGLPCILTNLPQTLNLRLDQIAMAAILPPRELGNYAVAVAWGGMGAPLLSAMGATLLPSIASQVEPRAGAERFCQGVRLASLLAGATCMVLAMLTPVGMVLFFGESYRAAVPAALVLVPAGSFLALNSVIQDGLRGLGYPYPVLMAELAGVVATAVGLVLTLQPLGIVGGALSSLAGYSTVYIVLLVSGRRIVGISSRSLICPRATELQVGLTRAKSLVRALVNSTE
jgi:antigen flippase